MAEGVAADVTIVRSVGEFADAYAVEDDPEYTVEGRHLTSCVKLVKHNMEMRGAKFG